MKVDHFDPPSSRTKFERALNLLAEAYNHERFHVAQGLSRSIEGLRRVRYLPNHRIDLLTVDESARLSANMMAKFGDHPPIELPPTSEAHAPPDTFEEMEEEEEDEQDEEGEEGEEGEEDA